MIGELMAALKAIPEIAKALREINTGIKNATASKRRSKKDENLSRLLAAARSSRGVREEAERSAGDNSGKSEGVE